MTLRFERNFGNIRASELRGKPVFFFGQHPAWRTPCKVAAPVFPLRLAASMGWLGAVLLLAAPVADAKPYVPTAPTVQLQTLPFEAQSTFRMIRRGGPFPYSKDGMVFGNRERELPPEPRGHYREYTVRSPGSTDRGARRIVCGGRIPTKPETCFYTRDHYTSFQRIVQ